MIWLLILSLIIISLTALPPLTEEDLRRESRYIVMGRVKTISRREIPVDEGTNFYYQANVNVVNVEKGLLKSSDPNQVVTQPQGTPLPGDEIVVHYWLAAKRPSGWSGVAGQHSGLSQGTTVRLYLAQDNQNRLHLLEPNGWQPIGEE